MNWFRGLLILSILFLSIVLLQYVPLIPKAIILMDDIHVLREKSTGWEKSLTEGKTALVNIDTSIKRIEKQFWFLKEDAKRRGQPWPDQ